MFILIAQDKQRNNSAGIRGVYSSTEELKKGVDYWSQLRPHETLAWEEWDANYAPEASTWDWGYIAPGSNRKLLAAGGGQVPRTRLFGKNLVGRKWWT